MSFFCSFYFAQSGELLGYQVRPWLWSIPMTEDRLTTLYRMYGPIIYARCVRLLGDRAGAEDAIQETFVRVQRHLDKAPDSKEALV